MIGVCVAVMLYLAEQPLGDSLTRFPSEAECVRWRDVANITIVSIHDEAHVLGYLCAYDDECQGWVGGGYHAEMMRAQVRDLSLASKALGSLALARWGLRVGMGADYVREKCAEVRETVGEHAWATGFTAQQLFR